MSLCLVEKGRWATHTIIQWTAKKFVELMVTDDVCWASSAVVWLSGDEATLTSFLTSFSCGGAHVTQPQKRRTLV